MSEEEYATRLLRLELALTLLIKEVVSGTTNPLVSEALMEFADQIRDEAQGPT